MNPRSGIDRALLAVGGLLLAAGVGFFAYNAGVAHALAQQPFVTLPAPSGTVVAYPVYYHPWGFFPFAPLFFLAFWFVMLRVVIGRRRWWGGPRGYYDYGPHSVPPMFEEWHRRAHARESEAPKPPNA